MKLFSYTCPDCDAYTRRIEGRKTTDGIQVQCPECGFVEEIGRADRWTSRGDGSMRCARCGDTIITDVPAPFCSHCWGDFGEFLDEHPAGTEPRRLVADGGQEDEVWDQQAQNRCSESELSFVRIADRINSALLLGLIGLYLVNRVVPDLGVPGLMTAFPFVAGLALIVLTVGIGMDTGALPDGKSHGERWDQ